MNKLRGWDHAAEPATTNERRATDAMWFGIVGVLLVFPFGLLLGPAALWSGISALRRIRNNGGTKAGSGRAIVGIVMGSIVCSLCAFALLVEVISRLLTGASIPAY
ncbi:MAG: hypothetical protein AUH40_06830 [Chloroflexi bacterium 13_1_40CM_65_17]|nr:MAG: hypothetical protein AUH40_06830 [Chloroflexi bacterium 13_1_40CM_65_17]